MKIEYFVLYEVKREKNLFDKFKVFVWGGCEVLFLFIGFEVFFNRGVGLDLVFFWFLFLIELLKGVKVVRVE